MRRPAAYAMALLPLTLAACAMQPAPEIATPTPDLPPAFFFKPEGGTSAGLAALMPAGDPAYRSLSEAALANGPSLAEAVARIDAARAGARRAGAERLPNISADADVTRNRINPAQFGQAGQQGFIPREQTSYGANIVASWDPDIFGQLKAQERAALARIDAASAQAQGVRLSLLSEIAGSVTDWRVLDARAEAIKADASAAQALAGLAKVREDAGIAPGFDRVRAEATASSSAVRLAALESERARLIGRLVASLGPLPATGGDWTDRLQAAPLGGGIRYDGNADTLFSLTGLAGQSIAGPVALARSAGFRFHQPFQGLECIEIAGTVIVCIGIIVVARS